MDSKKDNSNEYGFKTQRNNTAYTETVIRICTSVIEDGCAKDLIEYWTTDGTFIGKFYYYG